jgi:hypothetical protein
MRTLSPIHILFIRFSITALLCLWAISSRAETIKPPEDFIGHPVGADYKLARWQKIVDYFRYVGDNSDRVNIHDMGTTTEGRPFMYAEISSSDAPAELARQRENRHKLADPRLIGNAEEEKRLVAESKVVVFINCNLHSNEIASSQMALELLYDLATGNSPQIKEILDRTIVLLVPSANPDGLEMVIDWYEKSLGKPWEGSGMPWIYHKYAGHDNNRDWFMLNLKETQLETKVMFQEWYPNIVYDIHQMGNSGARLFVPPFFDPKNPNIDPLNDDMMLILGGHIAAELTRAGKKGVLHNAMYDNWWNGGFRTVVYRHNMVGILTEAASVNIASPVFQQKSELRGNVRGMTDYSMTVNFPDPWPGGWWRLRDIVDYEKISCMSVFTLAARYHDLFLSDGVKLAREALERGKTEPPFAWLVPPDQHDPGTAAEMLRILHDTGLEVHQAEEKFTADDVPYPAGTYILYCAQPYRAHLNDMMEPQVYPNRVQYPGGPPEAPYDIAGWTLPLQMGVRRVSVNQPFSCRVKKVDKIPKPRGKITEEKNASGYVVRAGANDDFRLINRMNRAGIKYTLISSGESWIKPGGEELPPGSLYIPDADKVRRAGGKLLEGISSELIGIPSPDEKMRASLKTVSVPRVGLYQSWAGVIDEGWTRFVLDSFEFPYATVHNPEIRAGNLRKRFDCLILPSQWERSILEGLAADSTEPQYSGGIGPEGITCLQNFVEAGGTLVCIDESCGLPIRYFNIPVRNVLSGKKTEEFYCPGSILRVRMDNKHPVGYGMPERVSGYFTRSQAFEVTKPSEKDSKDKSFKTEVVARYADTVLLESGWIRGEGLIMDKPSVVEVSYGKGKIVLLGFRIQHRGQPHGTFRLLFNAIEESGMKK